jgi:hypothetical protein
VNRLSLLRVASLPFDVLGALGRAADPDDAGAVVSLEAEIGREAAELSDLFFERAGPAVADAERSRARFAVLRLRRDVHNGKIPRASDLGEARTLLAGGLEARLEHHAANLERRAAALSAHAASHRQRIVRCRRELLRLAADPLVGHGIYLASRSLLPKVRRLVREDPEDWSHDQRHTAAKLAAYVARFATKTSPNGVFCSVALARLGGPAASIRGSAAISHVDVLLNLAEARKVSACLAVDPALERAVMPRPNPTLLESGGSWTFWKPASPRHANDAEVLSRVKDQPLLRIFLDEAARETLDPVGLVDAVAARAGRDSVELRPFYELLVERGVLIGEVEIPYSSRRRLRDLVAIARRGLCEAEWIPALERIENAVDEIPSLPLDERNDAMDRIVTQVASLPRTRIFKPDELFRVDAASGLSVQLPGRVFDELSSSVRVLVRLLAGMYPEAIGHRRLVSRFLKHHPADVDVSFLDLYRGFADKDDSPGVAPLEFPSPSDQPPADPREAEAWACMRRTWEWFVRRARETPPGDVVELDERTARLLSGELPEPRWAAGALFQIAAATPAELEAGRCEIVLNALFNGIGLALSRFAHLLGDEVIAELRRAWRAMERPGAVLAEITFTHEARTANAGLRPVLFSHEIELPGELASRGVERIPLHDLSIRFDASIDRLVLRSVSKDVEVIPVLSSGVSPSGIVSDLIHIGRQGWQTVGYLPGFQAPEVERWPRFVCGNVTLFRARWTFRRDRMPPATRGGAPLRDADYALELARWRARHDLPRHVFVHTLAESKPFYVDFESPVLTDLLRRAITTVADERATLYVTEMHPGPDALWVRDATGSYASEFLVQLDGPDPSVSS